MIEAVVFILEGFVLSGLVDGNVCERIGNQSSINEDE